MHLANDGAQYGAGQYRFARNYELKGRAFVITSPDKRFTLSFIGLDKAVFDRGNGGESLDYECLKIEKDTYFLRFGTNAAVLELAQGLATVILPESYVFGVIEQPGQTAAGHVHGYTDEMTGTAVRWILGVGSFTDHVYINDGECNASWSPKESAFALYPAKYVKIKEGLYLVDVTGPVPAGVCAPQGCRRVLVLQDYEHMMLVGCLFCDDGMLMISGYGEFPAY